MNMDAGMDIPLQKGKFFIGDDAGHWEEVEFEDALHTVMNAVNTRCYYEFKIDPLGKKIFIKCGHPAVQSTERRSEHQAPANQRNEQAKAFGFESLSNGQTVSF